MNRLLPFVFIILAIVLFFGYIRPTWDGPIATTKADIASYDSALTAASQFSDNEAKLTEERDAISPDQLSRLNIFLPDSVNTIQLIIDMNALAARAGVAISNVTIGQVPNAPASSADTTSDNGGTATPLLDSLTSSFSVTGTYDSFRQFLSGMEQSLRPIDITSLSVTDSDTGVYTYNISVKFYWLH